MRVFLLLAVLGYARAARINNFAGPFSVIIHAMEECEDEVKGHNILRFNGIVSRDRNTTDRMYFNGNITCDQEVDYTMGVIVNMASWDPVSGWRPNAFRMPFPEAIKSMESFLPNLWEDLKVAWGGGPTIPKGHFTQPFRVDRAADVRNFKNMVYGKFKVHMLIFKRPDQKKTLGCLRVLASTVPKKA